MAKCLPEKTRALVRQVQWQVPNQRIIPSLTEEYDQICDYKRGMLCDPVCHAVECSTKHTRTEGTAAECAPAGFVHHLEWKLQPRRRMSAVCLMKWDKMIVV